MRVMTVGPPTRTVGRSRPGPPAPLSPTRPHAAPGDPPHRVHRTSDHPHDRGVRPRGRRPFRAPHPVHLDRTPRVLELRPVAGADGRIDIILLDVEVADLEPTGSRPRSPAPMVSSSRTQARHRPHPRARWPDPPGIEGRRSEPAPVAGPAPWTTSGRANRPDLRAAARGSSAVTIGGPMAPELPRGTHDAPVHGTTGRLASFLMRRRT